MLHLSSGTKLANRYTLVRKLGSGGDATVWLAEDRMTGGDVALKIPIRDGAISAAALRLEWQTGIRLMHSHIVRIFEFHDVAPGNDSAFFSMQFIDGPGIAVLSGGEVADVLAPIAQVADALRYAHAKDVVHADIKAGNILLDANGAPYLIDFGVALRRESTSRGGSLIASSPARLDGQRAQPADDIFALGGVIYELISGTSPYSSLHTEADIRTHVPPLLTRPDGSALTGRLQQLVAAMLAKDESERPDAEAVCAALQEAGIEAGPAPRHYLGGPRAFADQAIETGKVVHHARADTAALQHSGHKGLTPRTVGIALAVLIGLLLAVVFLLPDAVQQPAGGPVAEQADGMATGDAAETSAAAATSDALPERDERVQARIATDRVLGQLLSKVQTLEGRAVERWGGLAWQKTLEEYKAGDAAYLVKDYEKASTHYAAASERADPLLDRVDKVFAETLASANVALENGDAKEALRLFQLAVAISPNHAPAKAGLTRAQNLDEVLALTDQGLELERQLELDAARDAFTRAIEIDPQWRVAADGLERVNNTIRQMAFDARMSEGLAALASEDYLAARAAFRMAKELRPDSPEPADGLLQVDQGLRLNSIVALENEARGFETDEQWQAAEEAYQHILELDGNLAFAKEGLGRSQEMIALHQQLADYTNDPDSLSQDRKMAQATQLVVAITRMDHIGPRLASARDELSRLLKRAATPLTVEIVSDEMTDVSVYKVAKLGTFDRVQLSLRPGTYVAVGSRTGYRDVRTEFRVAPEIDMQPVVVRCEERI